MRGYRESVVAVPSVSSPLAATNRASTGSASFTDYNAGLSLSDPRDKFASELDAIANMTQTARKHNILNALAVVLNKIGTPFQRRLYRTYLEMTTKNNK